MPRVNVCYIGLLRNVAGVSEEEVVLPAGATVRNLITALAARHGPDLSGALLLAGGQLRESAMVLINNRNVQDMAQLDSELGEAAEVAVAVGIYPIAGG